MHRRLAQILALALITMLRVAFVAIATPVGDIDSVRYLPHGTPLSEFLFAAGAGPGITTTLIAAVAGTDHRTVVVQTAVAATLWAAAAWIAAGRARSWLPLLTVLGISIFPWSLVWDATPITEPVAIAALALLTVTCLRAPDKVWVIATAACLALLTRPTLIPLVALVLTACLSRSWRRQWLAIAVVIVVAGFASWDVYRFTSQQTAAGGADKTTSEWQAATRAFVRHDVPGWTETALRHGMPACGAATLEASDSPSAVFDDPNCPELRVWLHQGGLSWRDELTAQPVATLAHIGDPWRWLTDSGRPYDVLDGRIYRLYDIVGIERSRVIVNLIAWTGTGLSLIIAFRRRGNRLRTAYLVAGCVGYVVLVCLSDGIEYWRHSLPAFVVLGLLWAGALESATPELLKDSRRGDQR